MSDDSRLLRKAFLKEESISKKCLSKKVSTFFFFGDLDVNFVVTIFDPNNRLNKTIVLFQDTYIDKVLHRFKMHDSKKDFFPMSYGITLSKIHCPSTHDERERKSRIPCASAIGFIIYDMICTHPDVACALSMMSRYRSDPGESHRTTVKNILKYLRNIKEFFWFLEGVMSLLLVVTSMPVFQTDKDDFRSQVGFIFCLNREW